MAAMVVATVAVMAVTAAAAEYLRCSLSEKGAILLGMRKFISFYDCRMIRQGSVLVYQGLNKIGTLGTTYE